MKFIRPILAGIVGATCMITFSYWYSHKKKVQFREPVLINKLAEELIPTFDPNKIKRKTG